MESVDSADQIHDTGKWLYEKKKTCVRFLKIEVPAAARRTQSPKGQKHLKNPKEGPA